MYKWLMMLMAFLFLGDVMPEFLGDVGAMSDYIVAMAVAFVAVPWIVAQFDS